MGNPRFYTQTPVAWINVFRYIQRELPKVLIAYPNTIFIARKKPWKPYIWIPEPRSPWDTTNLRHHSESIRSYDSTTAAATTVSRKPTRGVAIR